MALSSNVPPTPRYPGDDSFKASKSLCDLLRPGVAGVFGPVTSATSYHVQALANTLHVPFIMYNFDYIKTRSEFSVNVHPHPKILGKAYADFVRKTGWKSFIVLYETEAGLVKLQTLHQSVEANHYIVIHHLGQQLVQVRQLFIRNNILNLELSPTYWVQCLAWQNNEKY